MVACDVWRQGFTIGIPGTTEAARRIGPGRLVMIRQLKVAVRVPDVI